MRNRRGLANWSTGLQPPRYLYNSLGRWKKLPARIQDRMLPQRSKEVQKKLKFIGIKINYIYHFVHNNVII